MIDDDGRALCEQTRGRDEGGRAGGLQPERAREDALCGARRASPTRDGERCARERSTHLVAFGVGVAALLIGVHRSRLVRRDVLRRGLRLCFLRRLRVGLVLRGRGRASFPRRRGLRGRGLRGLTISACGPHGERTRVQRAPRAGFSDSRALEQNRAGRSVLSPLFETDATPMRRPTTRHANARADAQHTLPSPRIAACDLHRRPARCSLAPPARPRAVPSRASPRRVPSAPDLVVARASRRVEERNNERLTTTRFSFSLPPLDPPLSVEQARASSRRPRRTRRSR